MCYHSNHDCISHDVGCRDPDQQFVKIGDTFMNDCNTWYVSSVTVAHDNRVKLITPCKDSGEGHC